MDDFVAELRKLGSCRMQMNEVLMDVDEWMDAMVGHDGQGKRLDGRRFELIHLWS